MLKGDVEHTRYAYKTMKYNLEQKYNTEWLDKVITEQKKNNWMETSNFIIKPVNYWKILKTINSNGIRISSKKGCVKYDLYY